jgi:hypothetical protein
MWDRRSSFVVCQPVTALKVASAQSGRKAAQSGDCHQFRLLELDGCTRFARRPMAQAKSWNPPDNLQRNIEFHATLAWSFFGTP